MQITFYPDSDDVKLIEASREYQTIWNLDAEKIVFYLENISGLTFKEGKINAIVFEGISSSSPLQLRASYPTETKKGTLVHELGHRLLHGNKIRGQDSLENHKFLYLILFDVWTNLYGDDFAVSQVEIEKKRSSIYSDAWVWALQFNKITRKDEFEKIKKQ